MPSRRAKRQRRSGRDEEGERAERPTVITAAGLLAFYEEEESLIKIRPIHVLVTTVSFIAIVVALTLLG